MNMISHSLLKKYPESRERLRKLLTSAHIYKPSSVQDIFLFSSRRSGSTLLAEALGAENKLRYINEPFGPKYFHRNLLNKYPQYSNFLIKNKILHVPDDFKYSLKKYVTDEKQTAICGPYNPARPNYHWISNRRIFKIIHCNPILDFFLTNFPTYFFIFLVRHPIATILSLNKSYGIQLSIYLQNKTFCKTHLTEDKVAYIKLLIEEGDRYKMWAAEWALDHLIPYTIFLNKPEKLPIISYESIVTQPKLSVDFLSHKLRLHNKDKVLKELSIPSASTSTESINKLKTYGSIKLVNSWRSKVSVQEERKMFEVIRKIGVNFYQEGDDFIQKEYCAM